MEAKRIVNVIAWPGHLLVELASDGPADRLTGALVRQLRAALDEAEDDPKCRALVITAQGGMFCADAELDESSVERAATDFRLLLERLATTPVVTVAVVERPAVGTGAGLAAACDVVIAGPAASFRLAEVGLGTVPLVIMPAIARRIGEHRALRLAMLGAEVDADAALAMGWADQVSAHPAAAVRDVLRSLRRSERRVIDGLKRAHRELFPVKFPSSTAT